MEPQPIDFSPYVPLDLLRDRAIDPEIARSMRGWPRARWLITADAADLDAATQADLLQVLGAGAPLDQRFLLVTSAPSRMAAATAAAALPNVGVLVHVMTQAEADARLPALRACPAAVRGALVRPPHEPIDLAPWLAGAGRLDWVIAAGVDAPLHVRRVAQLRDQCAASGVPFWFDGWGDWVPITEVWPPEHAEAPQDGAWLTRPHRAGELPMLTYRIGPHFPATIEERWRRQCPPGWAGVRMRAAAPFVAGATYRWDAIASFIRTTRGVDPSPLDEAAGVANETLTIQTLDGARLATFVFTSADATWRCTAVGSETPAWATHLLHEHPPAAQA